MATVKKTEAGEMPCQNDDCDSHLSGRPVIVFENAHGTLSYTCDKCGSSQYAKQGDKVREHWMRRMGRTAPPRTVQPAASVAPVADSNESATAAAPAPKKQPASMPWEL